MNLFPTYRFELQTTVPTQSLLNELDLVLTVSGNVFTRQAQRPFRILDIALVDGTVEPDQSGARVFVKIYPTLDYRVGTPLWLSTLLAILCIAVGHQVRQHYFTLWTLFIIGIGLAGYLLSWWLYRASVQANLRLLQHVARAEAVPAV